LYRPAGSDGANAPSGSIPSANLFPSSGPRQTWIPGVMQRGSLTPHMLHELYRSPENPITPIPPNVDPATGEILEPKTTSTQASTADHPDSGPSQGIRLVGRFSDLYLLLQAGDDLYIVDQHTAHERVLFEETLRRLEQQKSVSQQLLLPVQVELAPEQLAVFTEIDKALNESGFMVSHFGGRMVNIEGVPSILSRKSPETTLRKVIDDIASLRSGGYDLKKAMAQSIACRAAVMSGDRLTDEEAIGLLEQLLRCENKYSCPHGRPTFICLVRSELDRQFGRC
jgi:DNA mismatch repair protein MutL